MANLQDVVKVAVDAYHGKVEKYSEAQSMDVLRQALVEANGGSTTLNYRNLRDGKCQGLFTLIEEILSRTVVDGLTEDDFFNKLVDFRNVAEGDQPVFTVDDSNLYVVSEAADGTQGIRRQRLNGVTEATIPTSLKVVKIYEELNRVLAGRVDFNTMINKVSESFRQQLLNDIYSLWADATSTDLGGATFYPTAGSYSEPTLLSLIEHVEAAAGGKTATLIGTKAALRVLAPSVQGTDSQRDIYNNGYYGSFYGNPVIAVPQRHKVGTQTFAFDDKTIHIVAGDEKPIKCVYEGDPIVLMGDPMSNADFTQTYMYGEKYGLGIVLAGGNAGVGRYKMT